MADENKASNGAHGRNAFGKYVILETLESGAIAELYKARDKERNRPVLLRALTRSASENPSIKQLFAELQSDRARFISDDPYVLKVIELGRSAGRYYIVFEHIDAVTLTQYLAENRPTHEEAFSILRQAAEGLRAFHQRRIVHGDVKPANILVGRDSTSRLRVKLSPIDIASSASEAMVSIYGELMGTPRYLSPEKIEGRPVELRSDIFSLGVVAFELFAGRAPFDAPTPLAVIRTITDKDAPPLAQVDTTVPTEVSRLVGRMLNRDPRRRYRTAQNLLEDLDRVEARMAGERVETAPHGADSVFAAQPTPHPVTRPSTLWRSVALAAMSVAGALVLVVILALAGVIQLSLGPQAPPVPPTPGEIDRQRDQQRRETVRVRTDAAAEDFAQLRRRLDEYVANSRYDTAIEELNQFRLKHGDTDYAETARARVAGIKLQKAEFLAQDDRFDEAVRLCKSVARDMPDSALERSANQRAARYLYEWQRLMQDKKLWPKAVALSRRLIEEYPGAQETVSARKELPDLLVRAAKSYLAGAEPAEAVAMLQTAVDDYPNTSEARQAQRMLREAQVQLATKMLGAGEYAEAAELLKKLRVENKGAPTAARAEILHAETLVAWAKELLTAGKLAEAVTKWKELMTRYPHSIEVERNTDLSRLAAVAEEQRTRLEKQNRPLTDEAILLGWARHLAEQDKADEALAVYRRVYESARETPEGAAAGTVLAKRDFAAAEKLERANKLDEAMAALERIAKEYPQTVPGKEAERKVRLRRFAPQGMALVPAGPFTMGTSPEQAQKLAGSYQVPDFLIETEFASEFPRHTVELPAYYVDITEVTNADYKKFIDATNRDAPAGAAWDGRAIRPDMEMLPVVNVSRQDAAAYAAWAGKRLPTEAEWEKAARGTDGRRWPWGDDFAASKTNLGGDEATVMPVGSFPQGASPYGCLDMAGNVLEWTDSPFLPYENNPLKMAIFSKSLRVVRGGAYQVKEPYRATTTTRVGLPPSEHSPAVGFRCVRDVPEAAPAE